MYNSQGNREGKWNDKNIVPIQKRAQRKKQRNKGDMEQREN